MTIESADCAQEKLLGIVHIGEYLREIYLNTELFRLGQTW